MLHQFRRVALPSVRRSFSSASAAPPPSFFRGVFPIMATPFNADESLDLAGFRKSIRFMKEAGTDGVTIVGVLGESNRMTDSEREQLIRAAVEVAADSPTFRVCVGTSHAGTAATAALSQMAQDLGADGVMVTPSKEAAPVSDDTMVEFFARVAEVCPGLPMVLQDHPASTQVHMSMPLLARIVREVPTIRSIKLESLPTPAKIAALNQLWSAQPPTSCTILTGLGALYGGFDLEQSTAGFMTGFAFPEILRAMNEAAQAGDMERAHAIYARFLPLIVFEQQPGVAVRKELYRLRGLIECNRVRHPAAGSVSPALAAALAMQLERSLPGVDVTKPLPAELFDV
jgi:4-hydroxy-tetrahydrodipicolinate synthase